MVLSSCTKVARTALKSSESNKCNSNEESIKFKNQVITKQNKFKCNLWNKLLHLTPSNLTMLGYNFNVPSLIDNFFINTCTKQRECLQLCL